MSRLLAKRNKRSLALRFPSEQSAPPSISIPLDCLTDDQQVLLGLIRAKSDLQTNLVDMHNEAIHTRARVTELEISIDLVKERIRISNNVRRVL
jgi:hypothetical protein